MNIKYFYELVSILTKKEIKIRYKNSFFGYLWSLANPLCFSFIYYIAFKIFMRIEVEDYTLFLICGLFPWQWISGSILNNVCVFIANATIIKKTNFPRSALPLSNILMEGFNFIISIPIIIGLLIFYDKDVNIVEMLTWSPLLIVITISITYGISLLLSSLNMFFRDIERFSTLFIMMLFYATPILYSENMIPDKYSYLIDVNPLAKIVLLWRELFLTGSINMSYVMDCILIALAFLFLGGVVFNKLKFRFAEVL